jgi:hypothetical protein
VMMTYADGHQGFFLEDEQDVQNNLETYDIYQRLMAPDDLRVRLPR